jgi:hypothetical protein
MDSDGVLLVVRFIDVSRERDTPLLGGGREVARETEREVGLLGPATGCLKIYECQVTGSICVVDTYSA